MQVLLKTLGCRLNEAELEQWASGFRKDGHTLTNRTENADLIVLNTCAVTQEAVRKSRQLIRRSHRNNPHAKLVVSGCYASLSPELQNDIDGIDLLIPNGSKDNLVNIVNRELSLETMPSLATEPGEAALFSRGRNRAFIKVQDGCRYRCTFCIVTVARGAERSRSISDVINEVNKLHEQGVQEFILTGVHIGGYGSDSDSDLFSLIKAVLAETDIPRLRLGSVEPWDLDENFFTLFQNQRFMPHLHLPLQSGSNKILKSMGRRCKTEDFERLMAIARDKISNINVTTDIIVGFPGETSRDWEEGLAFIEQIGFSHLHIFPYSPRAGTRAAELPEQISSEIRKQRSAELHKLACNLKRSFLQNQQGNCAQVLFEHHVEVEQDRHIYTGYTPNYIRAQLAAASETSLQNCIRNVKLTNINSNGDGLLAELL